MSNVNGGLPFYIRSYSWGVVSPRDAASGHATGQVRYEALSVTRPIDPLTPPLFTLLVNNGNVPTREARAARRLRKAGSPVST